VTARVEVRRDGWDGRSIKGADSSKGLAHTHTPCPTILASGEVSAKIDVVFATQLTPRPSTRGWQEVIDPERLASARDHFANTRESGHAELFWQRQAILQLGCEHVAIEILSGETSCPMVEGGETLSFLLKGKM
jgi:hypothetical protein